jgi:hypothetical protein
MCAIVVIWMITSVNATATRPVIAGPAATVAVTFKRPHVFPGFGLLHTDAAVARLGGMISLRGTIRIPRKLARDLREKDAMDRLLQDITARVQIAAPEARARHQEFVRDSTAFFGLGRWVAKAIHFGYPNRPVDFRVTAHQGRRGQRILRFQALGMVDPQNPIARRSHPRDRTLGALIVAREEVENMKSALRRLGVEIAERAQVLAHLESDWSR